MIQVIIKDGLGNQLFQYAYARFLQYLYCEKGKMEQIAINPYFIQHTEFKDNDKRDMAIHHFFLNDNVIFLDNKEQIDGMNKFKRRCIFATPLCELYRWRIKKQKIDTGIIFKYRGERGLYYTYSSYTDYPSPISKVANKFVFGFFQTESNFSPIADVIRKELKVKDLPSRENADMIKHIQSLNAVCLHIRRGDYLNPRWKNLQICTFEYYNNAINIILDKVEEPVFFVFSNTHSDIEWIRENYHFKDEKGKREIKLVYVDMANPDYEELRLMYSCKHFIISNSTFSWWGAWLSDYSNKVVCAPDRWNLSTDDDSKIYCKDWIKVKTK